MIELLNLTQWKTKKEILNELLMQDIKIDERQWRLEVERYNEHFYNHEIDTFIAHSSKGYKLTSDVEEIKESLKDNHKRALDMLYKESRIKKAIGENYNMKLIIDDNGFFVVDN